MDTEKVQKILKVILFISAIALAISGAMTISSSGGVTVMLSIFLGCIKITIGLMHGYFAMNIDKVDSGIMLKGFAISGIVLLLFLSFTFAIINFALAAATKVLLD